MQGYEKDRETDEMNPLRFLAMRTARGNLHRSYVSPAQIAEGARKMAQDDDAPELDDAALQALSTMFTMIKTFLDHQEQESKGTSSLTGPSLARHSPRSPTRKCTAAVALTPHFPDAHTMR